MVCGCWSEKGGTRPSVGETSASSAAGRACEDGESAHADENQTGQQRDREQTPFIVHDVADR